MSSSIMRCSLLLLLPTTVSCFLLSPGGQQQQQHYSNSNSFVALQAARIAAAAAAAAADDAISDWKNDRERLDHQFLHAESLLLQDDNNNNNNSNNRQWDDYYQELQTFYHRHQHTRVPRRGGNTDLYEWCQQQQQSQSLTTTTTTVSSPSSVSLSVSNHRLFQLTELGFWTKQLHTQTWDEWYLQLFQFYLDHGHSNVACTSDTLLLAQWVHVQRSNNNNNNSLSTTRQKKLLWSVNFCFDPQEADFETQYQRLLELEQTQPIFSVRQWKKTQQQKTPVENADTPSWRSKKNGLFGTTTTTQQRTTKRHSN